EKYFPFYSAVTMERALTDLEKIHKAIESKQIFGRDSRVKSYTISPEGRNLMASAQTPANCGDSTQQNDGTRASICSVASCTESESNSTAAASLQIEGVEEDDTTWLVKLAEEKG